MRTDRSLCSCVGWADCCVYVSIEMKWLHRNFLLVKVAIVFGSTHMQCPSTATTYTEAIWYGLSEVELMKIAREIWIKYNDAENQRKKYSATE